MSSEISLEDRAQALENEYFRRREQELIGKMKAKLEAEKREATGFPCPKCSGKLVESDFEGIRIDVCSNCSGIWLDAGEFARIIQHEESKGSWFGRWFS